MLLPGGFNLSFEAEGNGEKRLVTRARSTPWPHYRQAGSYARRWTLKQTLARSRLRGNVLLPIVKGPNVAGLDPDTRELVRLFHPRRDSWAEHFVWDRTELKARTQMKRVTIAVLVINDPEVVAVRRALEDEGVLWR